MKIIVAVALVLIVLLALPRLFASGAGAQSTDGDKVTIASFPALIQRLESAKSDGSFWVVLVPGTARSDGLAANLQFSIEDGEIGMDWVLNSEANLALQEKFSTIVRSAGLQPRKKTSGGLEYIRVTGISNPAQLGQTVLEELFHKEPSQKMQLIVTGFTWPEP